MQELIEAAPVPQQVIGRTAPEEWALLLSSWSNGSPCSFNGWCRNQPIQCKNQPISSLKKANEINVSNFGDEEFCRPLHWFLRLIPPIELELAPIAEAATGD
jgi:hypothetical protein